MATELSYAQSVRQAEFRTFVAEQIAPYADRYDGEGFIPRAVMEEFAARGYLGMMLPRPYGGEELDAVSYGLLHHEISQSLSSLAAMITVHDMAGHAIHRWSNSAQKGYWLPKLIRGECLAAFGVSETNAGSDVRGIETRAEQRDKAFVLNGTKKWLTAGQIADVFVVLAKLGEKLTAFLVERERPGVSVTPISGMLGLRAGMLADVKLVDCEIPEENLLGRPGFAVESVIQTALDLGRYNVAWGCVGLAQACLELSLSYADERHQFGVRLREHQLIAQMLSDMICEIDAARLLCWRAGCLRDANDVAAMTSTLSAKYFASRTAMKSATNAIQIHGANGCSDRFPLQRYMRDAKVMEIIEGSSQIQQVLIAQLSPRRQPASNPTAIAAIVTSGSPA